MEHKNRHDNSQREKDRSGLKDRPESLVPSSEDVAESRRFVETITRSRKHAHELSGDRR